MSNASQSGSDSNASPPPPKAKLAKKGIDVLTGRKQSRWTVQERSLLKQYVEQFRLADIHGRRDLLSTKVLPELLSLPQYKASTDDRRRELTQVSCSFRKQCFLSFRVA